MVFAVTGRQAAEGDVNEGRAAITIADTSTEVIAIGERSA
jgi:hypothetical protein